MIEVLRKNLCPHDVLRVRQALRGIRHDGNKHMLFLVEATRVGIVRDAHDAELIRRHPPLPCLAKGKGNQLRHVRADGDRRLADAEQLVDEGEKDAQDDADDPGAHSGAGRGGIVFVVNHGTNLGIGTVVGDEGGLELHLDNEGLVLLGVGKDVIVGEEVLDALDDDMREIWVTLMDAEDVGHQLVIVSVQIPPLK